MGYGLADLTGCLLALVLSSTAAQLLSEVCFKKEERHAKRNKLVMDDSDMAALYVGK